MHEREAGLGQHRLGQAGDAADHVETDAHGPPCCFSSSIRLAIVAGVFASLRSMRTTPSWSMAVTQWTSLAMSIPTLIRMALPGS
jgi:hypothetical protein